ncbi:hypothetical protein MTO96_016158 [Rhipicephalus appendiculatus]
MGALISCLWPQCVDGVLECPRVPVSDDVPTHRCAACNIGVVDGPPLAEEHVSSPTPSTPPPQHRNATRSKRVTFTDE